MDSIQIALLVAPVDMVLDGDYFEYEDYILRILSLGMQDGGLKMIRTKMRKLKEGDMDGFAVLMHEYEAYVRKHWPK